MSKYKIIFDREECIGCSACAAVNPDFWEMESDGKSSLKDSLKNEDESFELELEENFEMNLDSAESCPVNCIHIYKKTQEKDEKII